MHHLARQISRWIASGSKRATREAIYPLRFSLPCITGTILGHDQATLSQQSSATMPKAAKSQTTPRPSPVKAERPEDGSVLVDKKPSPESPTPKGKNDSSAKAWTAEETWALYQLIHPKPAEIPWKDFCKHFPGKDQQVGCLGGNRLFFG